MSRRNTIQGLKVLATRVDEIARVDAKFVSHWSVKYVKVRAEWGCRGETLCQV